MTSKINLKFVCVALSAVTAVCFLLPKQNEPVFTKAETNALSSVDETHHEVVGASIRLPNENDSSTSIRFRYRADKSLVSNLHRLGVLVAPEYKLGGESLDLNYVSNLGAVGQKIEYIREGNPTENTFWYGKKEDNGNTTCGQSEADSVFMQIYCYDIPIFALHQNLVCVGYYQEKSGSEVVYTSPKVRNLAWVGGEALRQGAVAGEEAASLRSFLDSATDHVREETNIQKNYSVDSGGYVSGSGSCVARCRDCGADLGTDYDMTKDLYSLGTYGSFKSNFRKADTSLLGKLNNDTLPDTGTVTAGANDGEYTVTGATYGLWMPNTAMTGDYEFQVTMKNVGNSDSDESMRGIAITDGELMISFGVYRWGQICVNISKNHIVQDQVWIGDYADMENNALVYYAGGQTWKVRRIGATVELWRGGSRLVSVHEAGVTYGETTKDLGWGDNDLFTTGMKYLKQFFTSNKAHVIGLSASESKGFVSTDTYKVFGLRSLQKEQGEIYWNWSGIFDPSRDNTFVK